MKFYYKDRIEEVTAGRVSDRQQAFAEVLERIENDLKVLSVAENHAPLHPHAIGSRKYAQELRLWLTKQIEEEG